MRRDMKDARFQLLLSRYLTGEASEQEVRQVEAFYAKNQSKTSRLKTWSVEEKVELKAAIKSQVWRATGIHKKNKRKRSFYILRVAASLLFFFSVLSGIYYVINRKESQEVYITKVTEPGHKATVFLSDGTTVTLNSGSKLQYPEMFIGQERIVKIEGEAFFNVAKDAHKPFIVKAPQLTTKVLGTSFNISTYSENPASVTLVTGRVDVFSEKGSVKLAPGDMAVLDRKTGEFEIEEADLQMLNWRNGVLVFKSAKLREVVNKLSRWYNVHMEVKEVWAEECLISATYENESLHHVLESLKFIYGLEYEIMANNKVILQGNPCKK
ncbi:FecR family protein [Fulvivirga sediminis]|uniref:FecR domain-containing protein n=1 Tax=Fulvivirga sediminis TaxID=2803949 RepID=A0A937K1U0_9BACT|nr:FecR family protein [Fulvivirga sediminis]MBL3658929.1 FecR domain-containing protein [Fulvivirga sediminis]